MIHLFANKISKTPICGQLFGIPTSLVLRQGEAFVLGPKLCAKNNLHSLTSSCKKYCSSRSTGLMSLPLHLGMEEGDVRLERVEKLHPTQQAPIIIMQTFFLALLHLSLAS